MELVIAGLLCLGIAIAGWNTDTVQGDVVGWVFVTAAFAALGTSIAIAFLT